MRAIAPRLALVVTGLLLVGLLGLQVWTDGPVTHLDQQLTLWLAGQRQPWLTHAMRWVSAAHQTVVLLAATLLLAGWIALRRDWRLLPCLVVVPVGMLANVGLKHLFMRPRPQLEDPLVNLATLSFPSGHAAASTVFYGAACAVVLARSRNRALRAAALALAVLMVAVVMFSRVYLGAHYASDVVAGVAVGAICLVLWLAPLWPRVAGPRGAPVPE